MRLRSQAMLTPLVLGVSALLVFAIGLRLLAFSRFDYGLPEFWFGFTFTMWGGVIVTAPLTSTLLMQAIGLLIYLALVAGYFISTTVTFQRTRWARVLSIAVCGAVAVAIVFQIVRGDEEEAFLDGHGVWACRLALIFVAGWMFVEVVRALQRLSKRERIGLGNPTLRFRLRLWLVSVAAQELVLVMISSVRLGWLPETALQGGYPLLALVNAVAMWFALSPTRAERSA